jgi:hypothetical protein
MEKQLKGIVSGILNKFSSESGDEKLQAAALWEELAGDLSKETKIVKIENSLMFVQVPHSVLAQELKLKVQRKFMVAYKETFGEKLKDIRFLIGS